MIYIIIPVHNRKNYTRNCLLSLRKQTYKNFKTIVIDDGSIDKTNEMLKKEFPEIILLKGDGNLWWTASINLGIKCAIKNKADYIMTLNNDTIPKKDFLEKMMLWTEKKPNFILGALELDAKTKKLIYGGEIIDWKTASYKSLLKTLKPKKRKGIHKTTHLPGRGLFIPSHIFKKIGLFDEKHLPHYAADFDFTHRAVKAGYNVYCNYDAKLLTYPEESGDKKNKRKRNLKNYYNTLFSRNGGGNLKDYFHYAVKNCPRQWLPSFLIIGIFRRIFGYPYHWIFDK